MEYSSATAAYFTSDVSVNVTHQGQAIYLLADVCRSDNHSQLLIKGLLRLTDTDAAAQ